MPYSNFDVQQQQQAVEQAGAVLRLKQNPYTDQDLAAAQAGVDQAQAQLDLAQIGLRDTTVTAPVDGVIAERFLAPGALVSPQTPTVTLVPPDLEVVADVAQNHLAHLDIGEPVQIQVDAFAAQTFAGSITTISPTVDARSRTATLRIKPQDDAGQLRAGMYAHVNILSDGDRGVLLVPRAALVDDGSSPMGEVIAVQNGIANRRPVTIGLQDSQSVEILHGLQPGDLVATSGLSDIVDGQPVNASEER
jgi:RND family efflux transporter MFP subunit